MIRYIALVLFGLFLSFGLTSQVQAQIVPFWESACFGQPFLSFFPCRAYCDRADCDSEDTVASQNRCDRLAKRFESRTGEIPPCEKNTCDGIEGYPFGLCNAYCEARDCDSDDPLAPPWLCNWFFDEFVAVTGEEPPCLQRDCDGVVEECSEEFNECLPSCIIACDEAGNNNGMIDTRDEDSCRDDCRFTCLAAAGECLGDCFVDPCQDTFDNTGMCGGECEIPEFGISGTCAEGSDEGICGCVDEREDDPCEDLITTSGMCGGTCEYPEFGVSGICKASDDDGDSICICVDDPSPIPCEPECGDGLFCIDGQCCTPGAQICESVTPDEICNEDENCTGAEQMCVDNFCCEETPPICEVEF